MPRDRETWKRFCQDLNSCGYGVEEYGRSDIEGAGPLHRVYHLKTRDNARVAKIHTYAAVEHTADGKRYRAAFNSYSLEDDEVEVFVFWFRYADRWYLIPRDDLLAIVAEAQSASHGLKEDWRGYHTNVYTGLDALHPVSSDAYGRNTRSDRVSLAPYAIPLDA
ncbi:hypothetical protein ACFL59_09455 [Planctomycetota bacterium]